MSELSLPLVWPSNCGCESLTLTTATRPSRTSSPLRFSFRSLKSPSDWPMALMVRVSDGAEAGEVRAAVDGVDVVGEAEDRLGVAVVVLERDLDLDVVAHRFHHDGLVVQHRLAAVEVLDELGDAACVLELGAAWPRRSWRSAVRSSVSVISRPLLRKASSRRRCARVS